MYVCIYGLQKIEALGNLSSETKDDVAKQLAVGLKPETRPHIDTVWSAPHETRSKSINMSFN